MEVDHDDVVLISGICTIGITQAILQCARFPKVDESCAAVDSLWAIAVGRDDDSRENPGDSWRSHVEEIKLRSEVLRRELLAELDRIPGRRGVRQARVVLEFASPFSESVYETEFRRIACAAGYAVEAQMQVRTVHGVRWADVGVRASKTCFEVSGDAKYQGPDDGQAYRIHQARRDGDIVDAGDRLANVTTNDVSDMEAVLTCLRAHLGSPPPRSGVRGSWTKWEAAHVAGRQ